MQRLTLICGLAIAACAVVTPGEANAAFTFSILSAPAGYNGPTSAGPAPGTPDSINFAFGSLADNHGRITVNSSREQFPTFASIGTTFQIKAALNPQAGTSPFVPAGTYTIRLRNDEFTLPPGVTGNLGVIHTSIVPFASPPGQPLASTTATSSLIGGSSVSVNGSPFMTMMDEKFTTKPDGMYTLDQIVSITVPEGGSGQFSVTSYVAAPLQVVPAPPALLLGVLGLPLFGAVLRRWGRKGPAADAAVAA